MRRTVWSDTGTRRDTNRWFDRECLAKKRAARRALNRFQRTGLEADKIAYNLKRKIFEKNIEPQFTSNFLITNEIAIHFGTSSKKQDKENEISQKMTFLIGKVI